MAEETRTGPGLDETRIVVLGEGLELHRVYIDALVEQELNARTMDPETFKRLVANIESGWRLESLPFCAAVWKDGKLEIQIVAGHHRVRSARKAGLSEIYILLDVTGLTRSEIVSKQLSHNAISGMDDQDTLVQMFQDMDRIEDMVASHIDPFEIGVYPPVEIPRLDTVKVNYETRVVTFMFLPIQAEQLDEVCERVPPAVDEIFLMPDTLVEKFERTMQGLGKRCDIRSMGAIVSKMCDIAEEWLEEHPEEEVPLKPDPKAKGKQQPDVTGRKRRPPKSLLEAYQEAKAAEKNLPGDGKKSPAAN